MSDRFICGEKKIWQNHEKSQSIIKLTAVMISVLESKVYDRMKLVLSYNLLVEIL